MTVIRPCDGDTAMWRWYGITDLVEHWIRYWLVASNHQSNTWLTHWGRVTHICLSKLTIIGSDNGLSPGRRQAIIWTNGGILLIGPVGANFSEILVGIRTFSFRKMHLKMASAKWRPFCLGLNVLNQQSHWLSAPTIQVSTCLTPSLYLNPLHAKFFRGNINIYLHFMSLLHIDMIHVLEILPEVRPGPTYST